VSTGFFLSYSGLCILLLLIFGSGVFFAPTSIGFQPFEDLGTLLMFLTIGFPAGFVVFQGPAVALSLFLASLWRLVVKRLTLLTLLCCFGFAFLVIHGFEMVVIADVIGLEARQASDVERIWASLLTTCLFAATAIYVWLDPRYRKIV
jgi:hypothetical protein